MVPKAPFTRNDIAATRRHVTNEQTGAAASVEARTFRITIDAIHKPLHDHFRNRRGRLYLEVP